MQATGESPASASLQPSSDLADVVSGAELEPSDGAEVAREPGYRILRWTRKRWTRKRWLTTAACLAAVMLLFLAYAAQARTMAATSESSAQALQAWDMMDGNVLLRGWSLSDVTFYTTEIPEYMLVELVRGLTGDVVHVAAALTYTMLIVLAGLLAAGRTAGRDRLVSVLVATGIMVAPALRPDTYLLLSSPDHLGTQVPLLLAWLILDRPRPRWWAPAVIGVLLAWAQVADVLVFYEGVVALLVVCIVRMYRRRGPLRGQWYELSLAVAALGSVAAARLALALIHHSGGFTARHLLVGLSTADDLSAGLWHRVQGVLQVFGADFFGLRFGVTLLVVLVHLAGLGLVGWAAAAAVRRFFADGDFVVQVVAVAIVIVMAGYLFSNKGAVNEIVGLLPAGAMLAGRLLGGRLLRAGLVPALAAVLACYLGVLAFNASRPPARSEAQLAASWLEAHHLTYGLAGYWQASSVTVDSGNCLSAADLRAQFGPPAARYKVGSYQVLIWHTNLLAKVRTVSWCGYAWAWSTRANPSVTPCP